MEWSWKSFWLQFISALALGMGLASWISTTMEARRGPDAPTAVLFSMMVGGLLAPIVPSVLSGWKGWDLKTLLVANLVAPALYSGKLAVGAMSLIVAIIGYLGAQKARAIVFYYVPSENLKADAFECLAIATMEQHKDAAGNVAGQSSLAESITRKIDFQVVEVISDGRVTGRNCGGDVLVGTVFSSLCRREFPVRKPGEDIVSPELVFVCDVSLRLDAVELYQRQMDFLATGYTAMLSLSGSGLDAVTRFVSAAPRHTYYSLCA